MIVIGLTGGIGSGKSTVCQLFSELGAPIIDADEIAKTITKKGTTAYLSIQKRFGTEFFDSNGELNRKQLRQRIFTDTKAKQWLENMLHPIIINEMKQQVQTLKSAYVIIEIPLISKLPSRDWINRILVIDSDPQLQKERASKRDKYSETEIEKIIASQMPREQRCSLASDIIVNDGDKEKLRQQVTELHKKYVSETRN